jgi:N-acetylmuramoyl-L-alanine amidase
MTVSAIDIMARTLYGEARGEYSRPDGGLGALIAVGNVIMNRFALGGRFGRTVAEVCQKPFQFSCWNPSDPNVEIIKHVNPENSIFKICLEVAEKLTSGLWPDITQGSDHYFSKALGFTPTWANGKAMRLCIGRHQFYKLGV